MDYGKEICFAVDTVTRDRIAASELDPRNSDFWQRHPASDGNKGYRTWKGDASVTESK